MSTDQTMTGISPFSFVQPDTLRLILSPHSDSGTVCEDTQQCMKNDPNVDLSARPTCTVPRTVAWCD